MDNKESFENAIMNTKLKNAVQKMKAVNFAAEFAKRGVNIDSGFSEEK
ncbi:MAG: hypothetical protein MJ163_00530 [Alphaproteobacteria bacterium]|nr:hypothetical protein [Alphaproteobacteria bacterium]